MTRSLGERTRPHATGAVSAAAGVDIAVVADQEDRLVLALAEAAGLQQRGHPGDLAPAVDLGPLDLFHAPLDRGLVGVLCTDRGETQAPGQRGQQDALACHRSPPCSGCGRGPRTIPEAEGPGETKL